MAVMHVATVAKEDENTNCIRNWKILLLLKLLMYSGMQSNYCAAMWNVKGGLPENYARRESIFFLHDTAFHIKRCLCTGALFQKPTKCVSR